MHIREAFNDYISSIKRLRPLTQEGYEQRLAVFIEWCEAQRPVIELETIKAKIVDQFIEHVRDTHTSHYANKPEVSTHTLAGYIRCIRIFLHWCIEDEVYEQCIKASTVKRIKMIKTVRTIIETFTKGQLEALFQACEQEFDEHLRERDRVILAVLLDTGIRANELCTLTIVNTHLTDDPPYITVLGKGGKWREVGLGQTSKKALECYITMFRNADIRREEAKAIHAATLARGRELTASEQDRLKRRIRQNATVFTTRYHETLTVMGLERVITRLGRWANIKGVRCSPHTFRHTFATNYLLNGGDVFKLSLLMGHEDVETTQVYLRTVRARQARIGPSVLDMMGI